MDAWDGEEFGRRCREAGLSVDELWLRYIGLGGSALPHDVERFMQGERPPPDQHDMRHPIVRDPAGVHRARHEPGVEDLQCEIAV